MKGLLLRFSLKSGTVALVILVILMPMIFSVGVQAERDEFNSTRERAAAAASLLHNPNFDNHIWYEFNKRYQAAYPVDVWLPAGDTYDDPQDWRLWFLDGTTLVDSESNNNHYQSYKESVKLWPFDFSSGARMVAGIYQEVSGVTPCLSYKFQMYGYSRQKEATDSLTSMRVGIEQTGWHPNSSTDPAVHSWPSTMEWGISQKHTSGFGLLEVFATALDTKITVFSYADALGGNSHKIHWDTGSLEVVPRTENLIDASQPLPSPSSVIQSPSHVVNQDTNSASISWNTGSTSTYGQLLYRVKGSGTWQYSSIHAWGVSHQVNLTGLQAGSTYEYVIVSYGYIGGTCQVVVSSVREFNLGTPLTDVSITGNEETQGTGYPGVSYTFTANASPSNATEPIDYVWQATDQTQVTHSDSGTQDSVTFSWDTTGRKIIMVTANNVANSVEDTYTIEIIGDEYEPDDDCGEASTITPDGASQAHTFHSADDDDWVYFDAVSGSTYLVEALTPPGSDADVYLEVYDVCGGGVVDSQAYTYTPNVRLPITATQSGYYLHLAPSTSGTDMGYDLSVRTVPETATPGVVVLVAGRLHDGDPLQSNIHHVADAAYQFFKSQGYDDDHIFYLTNDMTADGRDNFPTRSNLFYAVTEWAPGQLTSQSDSSFTLYMADHGGYDVFYLDGNEHDVEATVSPADLDTWLTTLEEDPSVDTNVTVIAEACQSGSFIDLEETLSAEGRVIIASTGAQQLAWATRDGVLFSDYLVTALNQGQSLYSSFQQAAWAVETAQPAQMPWLDDDGDGSPNEGTDGAVAAEREFISVGTLGDGKWPPYIFSAGLGEIVAGQGVITAEVLDDDSVSQVWAVVYPPIYEPPTPSGDGVDELVLESSLFVTLTHQGNNVYQGAYDGFSTLQLGSDRVVIYAVDDEGLTAWPRLIGGTRYVYLPLVYKASVSH